eukprot:SAG11_NODE_33373_length_277_cov_2.179775_1_plen_63_part_01
MEELGGECTSYPALGWECYRLHRHKVPLRGNTREEKSRNRPNPREIRAPVSMITSLARIPKVT